MGVYQSERAHQIMERVLDARGLSGLGSTFYAYGEGEGKPFWIPPHCSAGDYCGNLVERSNVNALTEELDAIESEHGIEVYFVLREAYGTDSVALWPRALAFPAIVSIVEGLGDYPLIDDSAHSELETEAQAEAWEAYGRQEFREALSGLVPEAYGAVDDGSTLADLGSLNPLDYPGFGTGWGDDRALPWEDSDLPDPSDLVEDIADDKVDMLASQAQECGVYPLNESGDSIWWPTEEMVGALSWEDLEPLVG